jgi:Putative Actinobacterial Holin-X, holin superfamily III
VALVGGIMNDAKDLLVQEWTMTKLEVQEELRKAKTAAIALGIRIGVIAVGGMLLMLMLVHVLVSPRRLYGSRHTSPSASRREGGRIWFLTDIRQQQNVP